VTEVMNHGKHAISPVPPTWGSIEQAEELLDIVKQTGFPTTPGRRDRFGESGGAEREGMGCE
jgi:hypothetical protein